MALGAFGFVGWVCVLFRLLGFVVLMFLFVLAGVGLRFGVALFWCFCDFGYYCRVIRAFMGWQGPFWGFACGVA